MTVSILVVAAMFAAPPPAAAPVPRPADDETARTFASRLDRMIPSIQTLHPKAVTRGELVTAGIDALYRAVNRPVPGEYRKLDGNDVDAHELFRQARRRLGHADELAGLRDFVHAANGFAKTLDPSCVLTLSHGGPFSMSEQECLGGFELDGIQTVEWIVYRIESGPDTGWRCSPPIPIPWTVKRVTPGLAAAAADLRPGDEILSINGVAVTDASAPKLLPPFLVPLLGQSSDTVGTSLGRLYRLTVRRDGRDVALALDIPKAGVDQIARETVFGYSRRSDEVWNYFPSAVDRIAYLRMTGFDDQTPTSLARALNAIAAEKPAGLLLDLRWTPGGSLQSGGRAASAFFRDDQELAKVVWKEPRRAGEKLPRLPLGLVDDIWRTLPLAVLVNAETYGGGETIAGAVKDHRRGLVIGQRTTGRGLFYISTETGIAGLRYRVTSGKIDYPSGRNRHRDDKHGPLDEWGVRPDPGYEIPSTADFSKRLREWHDRATIRPAGGANAVALDDPLNDTQRVLAFKLFRESLRKKK
jgi:carboxyl-terminal processing protease